MPSSNIHDGQPAVHIMPFTPQETSQDPLYPFQWKTVAANVIRPTSAVARGALPLFTPPSPSALQAGGQEPAHQNATRQGLSFLQGEPQQPAPKDADLQKAVEEQQEATETPGTECATLLQQAQEEAARCLSAARQQAETIRTEAYHAGFCQGEEAGRQGIQQQLATVLASFQHAIEEVTTLRHAILRQAEDDIITLAFYLARKITHQEALHGREVVVATLQRAVDLLVDRDTVVMRVHPADFESAQALQQERVGSLSSIRHLTIEADETIGRGGCVLESAFGAIDARLESQFAELEQRFRERYGQISEADIC